MSKLSKSLRCFNPTTGFRDGKYCVWEGERKCLKCQAADEIEELERDQDDTRELILAATDLAAAAKLPSPLDTEELRLYIKKREDRISELELELEKLKTHTFVDLDQSKQHDLLKRYIQHVYDSEGVACIWSEMGEHSYSRSKFTREEVNLLENIHKEIRQ
jgi:hypothetical protein